MTQWKKIIVYLLTFVGLTTFGASFIQNQLQFGDGTAGNKRLLFKKGSSSNPEVRWNNSTSRLEFANDGTVFSALGSGSGSSGVNYISNSDADSGVTGWSAYADAAGTSPVDGTGGSPSATITQVTSTPLRGAGMFRITKGATNRQGDGVSTPFTIAVADQGKPLTISFEYQPSANFVAGDSSDIRIYVYDVTNSTLIQPGPYTIQGGSGATQKFSSQFQTASNSTSYRLIFHIATTNASAWTFDMDQVSVGPQVQLYGAAVTDWKSVTMTVALTGGSTTVTAYERRVGDNAEYLVDALFSTVFTGGTATFTLPSGRTIDTTKLPSTTTALVGRAEHVHAGSNSYVGGVYYASTTTVVAQIDNDDSGTGSAYVTSQNVISTTNPFTWVNNDRMFIRFQVPIVGWSSNVAMSSDADTRVVAASYENTAGTSVSSGGAIVPFATKKFDTHGAVSGTGTSWVFTAPMPGYYRIEATIQTQSASWVAGNTVLLDAYKNGAAYVRLGAKQYDASITGAAVAHGASVIQLNAGDTLALNVTSAQTVNLSTTATFNTISITRMSGPSAIAANEFVGASYQSSATTSIANNSVQILDYATQSYDTHGAVTTGASWKFSAPTSGTYNVCAAVVLTTDTGWASSETIRLLLYKNGVAFRALHQHEMEGTSTHRANANGCTDIKLIAGDYIDIRLLQVSGAAINQEGDATYNYVTVARRGF